MINEVLSSYAGQIAAVVAIGSLASYALILLRRNGAGRLADLHGAEQAFEAHFVALSRLIDDPVTSPRLISFALGVSRIMTDTRSARAFVDRLGKTSPSAFDHTTREGIADLMAELGEVEKKGRKDLVEDFVQVLQAGIAGAVLYHQEETKIAQWSALVAKVQDRKRTKQMVESVADRIDWRTGAIAVVG